MVDWQWLVIRVTRETNWPVRTDEKIRLVSSGGGDFMINRMWSIDSDDEEIWANSGWWILKGGNHCFYLMWWRIRLSVMIYHSLELVCWVDPDGWAGEEVPGDSRIHVGHLNFHQRSDEGNENVFLFIYAIKKGKCWKGAILLESRWTVDKFMNPRQDDWNLIPHFY